MAKSKVPKITKFEKSMEKILISRGVPPQDLPSKNTRWDIEESLVKIEPDIPGIIARPINTTKQFKLVESLLEHPLRSSTLGISSFPSDAKAKQLAILFMKLAVEQHYKRHKPGRALPLWHRVYGGFSDPLRDKPIQEIPSLLIITNISLQSSSVKMEKVRDLLEKFSEVPKIVVTGGEPACNIFATKLHAPLKACIYLGPDNRIREVN
jgi:hypothetical protein